MASQITSLTIVYSTVYSGTDEIKHQSSASLAFVGGNSPVTGEFPAHRASNAVNVSNWWRHHALCRRISQDLAGTSSVFIVFQWFWNLAGVRLCSTATEHLSKFPNDTNILSTDLVSSRLCGNCFRVLTNTTPNRHMAVEGVSPEK